MSPAPQGGWREGPLIKKGNHGLENEGRADDPLKGENQRLHQGCQREGNRHGYRHQRQHGLEDPILGAQRRIDRPDARQRAPQHEQADRGRETTQEQGPPGAAKEHDEGGQQDEHRDERPDVTEDSADALARETDEKHGRDRVAHHALTHGLFLINACGSIHRRTLLVRHTRHSRRGGSALADAPTS